METAIVKSEGGQVAPTQTSADAFLTMCERVMRDPSVDVSKLERILEVRERIMAKEAEIAFTEAMNRVQASVPRIEKKRKIIVKGTLRSKYAALEDIDEVLRPLTIQEGFSLSYTTEDVPPKGTKLILTVKHRMGHKENYSLVLPIEKTEFRSAAQDVAATISFGKRILRCSAFDIITVEEDTDGHRPSNFITEDQALTIATMLRDLGLKEDDQRFLSWAGADKIEHIEKAAYPRIIGELEKRLQGARK